MSCHIAGRWELPRQTGGAALQRAHEMYFAKLSQLVRPSSAVQIAFDGSAVGKFSDFVVFCLCIRGFNGEEREGSLLTNLTGLPQVTLSFLKNNNLLKSLVNLINNVTF